MRFLEFRPHTAARVLAMIIGAMVVVGAPSSASAESGVINLHLDVGFGAPLTDPIRPRSPKIIGESNSAFGGVAWLSGDWQFSAPLALELIVGGGGFARRMDQIDTGTSYGTVGIGLRWRIIDDEGGYLNLPTGNFHGNLWASAHIGFHSFDSQQFGFDVAVGYEASVFRPLQVGVFVRAVMTFGGENQSSIDSFLVAGISLSLDVMGEAGPADSDGDGLTDQREAELGLDPNSPDSDRDGIPDGIEVDAGYDPLQRDSDSDGLNDNDEDENGNGVLDAGETDPTRGDTDGGGIPDLDEVRDPMQDPRDPADDDGDGDGVANNLDSCPNSSSGEQVGATGCAALSGTLQLEGVEFATGSADILPSSESTLNEALGVLRGAPNARVEIAGHTDDRGNAANNRRLSQRRAESVLEWLVEHGLGRDRFTTRGYGPSEPIDTNDTSEGRQRNRRIEFRRLD